MKSVTGINYIARHGGPLQGVKKLKAISIRQPWAWLIANGYKDIENRTWKTKYRGPVLIHASKGMTRREFNEAMAVADSISSLLPVEMPCFEEFERGGIVGVATITDCVDSSQSPWFSGPQGFTLADAKPLQFVPMKGQLSFFETHIEPEDKE